MSYARVWVIEKAAEKKAGISPCKDCEFRKPACAGSCDRYKEWRQRLSEIRKEMLGLDQGERAYRAYQRTSYDRAVKNHDVTDKKWGSLNNKNRYT